MTMCHRVLYLELNEHVFVYLRSVFATQPEDQLLHERALSCGGGAYGLVYVLFLLRDNLQASNW